MVSELDMANSITTNSNSTVLNQNQPSHTSSTFTAPVKRDRYNFILWQKQVVSYLRDNQLESFISETQTVPDQYLPNSSVGGLEQRAENLA